MPTPPTSASSQLSLPFSAVRNSELFSNHWLEHRLPLDPDFTARAGPAHAALESLATLWTAERTLAPKYTKEAQLEKAFIQPVLEALGWNLIYQCSLRGRKPDYALFPTPATDTCVAPADTR